MPQPPTSVSLSIRQTSFVLHSSSVKEKKQFAHNSFVESKAVWKFSIFGITILSSGSHEYTALDWCSPCHKGQSSFVLITDKEG